MQYEQVRGYVRKKRKPTVNIEQFSLDSLFLSPLPIPKPVVQFPEVPAADPYAKLTDKEKERIADELIRNSEKNDEYPAHISETFSRKERLAKHRAFQRQHPPPHFQEPKEVKSSLLKRIIDNTSLTVKQQEVLKLRFEGHQFPEMIRLLTWAHSKQSVHGVYHRAIIRLRETATKMKDVGVEELFDELTLTDHAFIAASMCRTRNSEN